jgi:hypothetical protein
MENTRKPFPEHIHRFFTSLSQFLETPLYFFGSVQRIDYIPGKSDIDIDIFTNNIEYTKKKLAYFLKMKKGDFKKVMWRLKNNRVIHGYKIMYKNPKQKIIAEFSLFNESVKNFVLEEHREAITYPTHALVLLYIVKFFYYQIGCIDRKMYKRMKTYLLHDFVGNPPNDYVIFNEPDSR